MEKYLNARPEAGKRFYQDFQSKGKVVMLNLLRFRPVADYTGLDLLKPDKEISGEEAYQRYIKCILPELKKAGSRILYYGQGHDFLIGPEAEKWDAVVLVEYLSVDKFMEFAQSKAFLDHAGHRMAALEDSRLLPTTKKGDFNS